MNEDTLQKILDEVEYLYEGYSNTRRATTQPHLWKVFYDNFPDIDIHPDNDVVRETLIEHSGSLPIMAIALYPYIQDDSVNLGDSLTMMAFHDIGELITGDEMTFTKNPEDGEAELEAGLKLLDPMFHEMYKDAETKTSQSAKFAKAIDKINPDILDYLTPKDVTIWRYKKYTGLEKPEEIIALIKKHKRPYMEWNPFLTKFHDHLMTQLKKKLSGTSL